MSDYKHEKVLRLRLNKESIDCLIEKTAMILGTSKEDIEDDLSWSLEKAFPNQFEYSTQNFFQTAPTDGFFIDYVLESDYDCACGDWGKTRALYDEEKEKYGKRFREVIPEVDMDDVRLVEYCWYNGCEAPDYYDEMNDGFYNEI